MIAHCHVSAALSRWWNQSVVKKFITQNDFITKTKERLIVARRFRTLKQLVLLEILAAVLNCSHCHVTIWPYIAECMIAIRHTDGVPKWWWVRFLVPLMVSARGCHCLLQCFSDGTGRHYDSCRELVQKLACNSTYAEFLWRCAVSGGLYSNKNLGRYDLNAAQ